MNFYIWWSLFGSSFLKISCFSCYFTLFWDLLWAKKKSSFISSKDAWMNRNFSLKNIDGLVSESDFSKLSIPIFTSPVQSKKNQQFWSVFDCRFQCFFQSHTHYSYIFEQHVCIAVFIGMLNRNPSVNCLNDRIIDQLTKGLVLFNNKHWWK